MEPESQPSLVGSADSGELPQVPISTLAAAIAKLPDDQRSRAAPVMTRRVLEHWAPAQCAGARSAADSFHRLSAAIKVKDFQKASKLRNQTLERLVPVIVSGLFRREGRSLHPDVLIPDLFDDWLAWIMIAGKPEPHRVKVPERQPGEPRSDPYLEALPEDLRTQGRRVLADGMLGQLGVGRPRQLGFEVCAACYVVFRPRRSASLCDGCRKHPADPPLGVEETRRVLQGEAVPVRLPVQVWMVGTRWRRITVKRCTSCGEWHFGRPTYKCCTAERRGAPATSAGTPQPRC